MLKHINYTVILTFLSLTSAIMGICFTFTYYLQTGTEGIIRPDWWSVICLLLCGLFDAFDGRVARTKKNRTLRDKRFGIQLDSLCDIVAFGILPCCIGFAEGMTKIYFIPIYVFYCACGIIRLSYFNALEEEELVAEQKKEEKTYTGMPITTVALIFPLFYMIVFTFKTSTHYSPIAPVIFSAAFLLCGTLFITPFCFKKPGLGGIFWMILAGVVEVGILVYLLLVKFHCF